MMDSLSAIRRPVILTAATAPVGGMVGALAVDVGLPHSALEFCLIGSLAVLTGVGGVRTT